MEKIFALIKQMEANGVIGRYAIGGAIGSIFWLEPITTMDIDVFVVLPTPPGGTTPHAWPDLRLPARPWFRGAGAAHHHRRLGRRVHSASDAAGRRSAG